MQTTTGRGLLRQHFGTTAAAAVGWDVYCQVVKARVRPSRGGSC